MRRKRSKTWQAFPEIALRSWLAAEPASIASRLNDQYRICFRWSSLGADAVEIVDYH